MHKVFYLKLVSNSKTQECHIDIFSMHRWISGLFKESFEHFALSWITEKQIGNAFSRGILINIDVFCCCYQATAYCERLLVILDISDIVSDILEFLFLHFATGLKEVIDIHGCNAI